MKTVIKFGAEWCGPCKMYAPKFEAVASTTPGIEFKTIDVDGGDPSILEYGVRNVPTTVLVENGVMVKKQAGSMSVDELKVWIG